MAGITIRDIGILFGYEVDENSENKVENSINSLKNFASQALGAIGISLSISGITSAIQDCVDLASNVEQMEQKFDVVFDDLAEEVDAWAENYADAIGRNKNSIKTYLADQQNLLVGFGMTREAGAELSEQMTTLALDIASFANTDEDAAVNYMTKAVMGETEAARMLGAVLNDSTREQAMYTLGLSGTYDSLDQLTKMQVNYQAILSQSPDAVGDCVRSMGSYESTMRQFNARVQELKQMVGKFFLPTFQKVLSFGAKGLTLLRDAVQKLSDFIDAVGGAEQVVTALGIAVAGVFAVLSISKIGGAVGAFAKLTSTISNLSSALKTAAAKAALLFAAFLLVALVVQDFISFMQGKDSLIGVMLEKSGVDCDALRDKVKTTWENIKSVFETAGNAIKNTFGKLLPAIQNLWDQYGEEIADKIADAVTTAVDKLNQFSEWMAENKDTIVKVAGVVAKLFGVFLLAKGTVGKFFDVIKNAGNVVKIFTPVLRLLGSVFKALANPIGIVITVIGAIAAVLYDLFNFMNGKDSVIGLVFEKLGIDSEAAREKITQAWEKVKTFLLTAWDKISSTATAVWGSLQDFWDEHGEQIKDALVTAWNVITGVLMTLWNAIETVATSIFGTLQEFWETHGDQIKEALVNAWTAIKNLLTTAWNIIKTVATVIFGALKLFWETWGDTILTTFSNIWETIRTVFSTALNIIADLFAVFAALYSGDWESLWENAKQLLSDAWNGILSIVGSVLSAIWGVISSVFSIIWGFLSGIAQSIFDTVSTAFQNLWDNIVEKVSGIYDSIVNGFQSAIDWITALPGQAYQWGADIINGIIEGISSVVGGIWGAITDGLSGVGEFVGGLFGGAAEDVEGMASQVDSAASNMGAAAEGVANEIDSRLGFSVPTQGPLSDFDQSMPDMMGLLSSGIEEGQPDIEAAIASITEAIGTPIEGLSGDAFQWGNNISASLSSGISSTDALTNIPSSGVTVPGLDTSEASQSMEQFVSTIQTGLDHIATMITNFIAKSKTAVSTFHSDLHSSVSSAGSSVRQNVSNVVESVAATIQSVMTAIPPKAIQWGIDIGEAIANGISQSLNRVKTEVEGVAQTIQSYVGFSEPETGPLSDFHTYMPDMIDLMTKGIRAGRSSVKDAIYDLAADMSVSVQADDEKSQSVNVMGAVVSALQDFSGYAGSIAKSAGRMIVNNKDSILSTASSLTSNMSALSAAAVPSSSIVRTATTNNSTSNRTINFNSEINQEFNGELTAQKNISRAAEGAADDTTGALARALAYAG